MELILKFDKEQMIEIIKTLSFLDKKLDKLKVRTKRLEKEVFKD